MEEQAKLKLLNGHIYRKTDGRILNFFVEGYQTGGEVRGYENEKVIVEHPIEANSRGIIIKYDYIAIENYTNEPIAGSDVQVVAVRHGTYEWNNQLLELWDCGTILSPSEEKQALSDARKKLEAIVKAKADADMLRKEVNRQKIFLVQSNAVVHLQSQATNGNVWAQRNLGLHYLNGQGCDTNRELAIKWLKMAAANDDLEASNKLVKIFEVSTNAVSVKAP